MLRTRSIGAPSFSSGNFDSSVHCFDSVFPLTATPYARSLNGILKTGQEGEKSMRWLTRSIQHRTGAASEGPSPGYRMSRAPARGTGQVADRWRQSRRRNKSRACQTRLDKSVAAEICVAAAPARSGSARANFPVRRRGRISPVKQPIEWKTVSPTAI